MSNKIKNNKKHFCNYCLQCFSSEKLLVKHKETCLKINGKQSVKLKSGSIKFKNHIQQLSVPFKVHDDFESALKGVRDSDTKTMLQTLKNIKIIFLVVLLIKFYALMIDLVSQYFFAEEKNAANRFIKTILEEYDYYKKVTKKDFNKNFVMSEKMKRKVSQVINAGYAINCFMYEIIK